MATAAEINVLLKLKDELSKQMSTIANNTKSYMSNVSDSLKIASVAIVGFGVGIAAVAKKALDSANESEKAEARLTQLAIQASHATMQQVEALKQHASALQNLGVVEGDTIMIGQGQLATFALTSDSIQKLTPALLDMAVANKGVNVSEEDMINLGNMVGKVMQGQVGALSRVGVTFSETQEKMLKFGDESERASILTEILAQNFGGMNEAMRTTTLGGIQAMKNTIGDLWEELGFRLQPIINNVVQAFLDFVERAGGVEGIINKLTEAFRILEPVIPIIAGAIGGVLVGAIVLLIASVGALLIELAPFIAIGAAIAGVVTGLIFVWRNWGEVQAYVVEHWKTLAIVLAPFLTILAPIIAGIYLLITVLQEILIPLDEWKERWNTVLNFISNLWFSTKTNIETYLLLLSISISETWEAISSTITSIATGIWDAISYIFTVGIGLINAILLAFGINVGAIWTSIKTTAIAIWNALVMEGLKIWNALAEFLTEFLQKIKETWITIWTVISDFFINIWDVIIGFLGGVWENIKEKFTSNGAVIESIWANVWQNISQKVSDVWANIKSVIADSINWIIDKINSMIEIANSLSATVGGKQIQPLPPIQFATGGIVPKYYASGGMSARGSDTVPAMLTPGELILNASQQKNLARNGLGGNNTFNLIINGNVSSREIAEEYGDLLFNKFKLHAKATA